MAFKDFSPSEKMYFLGSHFISYDEALAYAGFTKREGRKLNLETAHKSGLRAAPAALKLAAGSKARGGNTVMLKLLLETYCGIREGGGMISDESVEIPKLIKYEEMKDKKNDGG